jgi:hypothetical protein
MAESLAVVRVLYRSLLRAAVRIEQHLTPPPPPPPPPAVSQGGPVIRADLPADP